MQYRGKKSGMDDHFDIGRVFEIGKFDIARLTCNIVFLSVKIVLSSSKQHFISVFSGCKNIHLKASSLQRVK